MRALTSAALAAAVALGASAGVAAQSSWLERGSSLLRGLGGGDAGSTLGSEDIAAGLREALRVGSTRVVDQLGARDGFAGDPAVRIALPESLNTVRRALAPLGMAGMLDDLETRLNRAAEDATPAARELFWDAIGDMSLDDARQIYAGPDDAATRYFQGRMSAPLAQAWRPVVERSLGQVGAVRAYEETLGEYARLPFMPDARANLTEHVIEQGLEGVFHYLAREEAAIRNEPLKRSTELLRRVFGGN